MNKKINDLLVYCEAFEKAAAFSQKTFLKKIAEEAKFNLNPYLEDRNFMPNNWGIGPLGQSQLNTKLQPQDKQEYKKIPIQAQQHLNFLLKYHDQPVIKEDGLLGPETLKAIKWYQNNIANDSVDVIIKDLVMRSAPPAEAPGERKVPGPIVNK